MCTPHVRFRTAGFKAVSQPTNNWDSGDPSIFTPDLLSEPWCEEGITRNRDVLKNGTL